MTPGASRTGQFTQARLARCGCTLPQFKPASRSDTESPGASRTASVDTAQGGFTLAELLVACAMVGLMVSAAAMALQAGLQTTQLTSAQADAQQKGRVAVDRMIQEIRAAGFDPTANGFAAVINPAADSITLQIDLNADGAITPPAPAACDPSLPSELVRYRLFGGQLLRSADPGNGACEAPIVGGLQALAFTYLDADDNVTAVPTNIRTITVGVTLAPENPSGPQLESMHASMADRVRLRNR